MEPQGLFDEYGRCLPSPEVSSDVHPVIRRRFICEQPAADRGQIHARITQHLAGGDSITAEEFETRTEAILSDLQGDPATANITNGVRVPFFVPQATYSDIGEEMDSTYLEAVKRSYEAVLPDYEFVNHNQGGLAGKLSVAPGSRHERLLTAVERDAVVGWYFPSLLEFSIAAAFEQTAALPEKFLLAGGFDTAAAFVGSPDLLFRAEEYPPLLWLAGLSAERPEAGYHFEGYGYNLTFNRRVHLDAAAEYWASGLVVIG